MFKGRRNKIQILSGILSVLLPFLMIGCGGGGGGGESGGVVVEPIGEAVDIAGLGNDGPIADGTILFESSSGEECGTGSTGSDAQYSITIPASCIYPVHLTLLADGKGKDLATGSLETANTNLTEMHSIVENNNASTVNISPITTLVYYATLAKSRRGSLASVAPSDVSVSIDHVLEKFGFGIDTDTAKFNPLTDPITADNVVLYTKANEGIIEMIRRSAKNEDSSVDFDKVKGLFMAIGTDISDGSLDGKVTQNGTSSPLSTFSKGDGGVDMTTAFATFNGKSTEQIISVVESNSAIVAMEVMTDELAITLNDGVVLPAEDLRTNLGKAAETVTSDPIKHSKQITAVEAEAQYLDQELPEAFVQQAKKSLAAAKSMAGLAGVDLDALNALEVTLVTIEENVGSGVSFQDMVDSGKVNKEVIATHLTNADKAVDQTTSKIDQGEMDDLLDDLLSTNVVDTLFIVPIYDLTSRAIQDTTLNDMTGFSTSYTLTETEKSITITGNDSGSLFGEAFTGKLVYDSDYEQYGLMKDATIAFSINLNLALDEDNPDYTARVFSYTEDAGLSFHLFALATEEEICAFTFNDETLYTTEELAQISSMNSQTVSCN